MQAVSGGSAPAKKVLIVMAGIAKVFAGEMVEEGVALLNIESATLMTA